VASFSSKQGLKLEWDKNNLTLTANFKGHHFTVVRRIRLSAKQKLIVASIWDPKPILSSHRLDTYQISLVRVRKSN
jgi:hypothetical protein